MAEKCMHVRYVMKIMKKRFLLAFAVFLLLPLFGLRPPKAMAADVPIIYIGDSRAEGLDMALTAKQKKRVIFYHATSQGYSWFVDNVAAKVTTQLYKYPSTRFRIVINLGINDHLGAKEHYVKKYNELAKKDWAGYDVYIVSITPVDEAKMAANTMYPQTNTQIEESNNYIKKNLSSNLHYVDLFTPMRNGTKLSAGFETGYDGAHYTPASYRRMWKLLMKEIS